MKILRILLAVMMAWIVSVAFGALLGINPLWVLGILGSAAILIPAPKGVLRISLFDLARPTGSNPGAGGGLDSEIILIMASDIDWANYPSRDADGVTISDIPLKAGKYMHRFYATQDTIEPYFKKLKGGNKDSGGYEVGVKGFYPGMELAILKWIANFGYAFEGIVIIQNCANTTKYILGEPCNLVICDNIESVWGSTVDKEKGNNFTFMSKQKNPLGIYSGAIKYDPSSASW